MQKSGLTDEQVKRSRERFGKNEFVQKKKKSFAGHVIENLKDPIIRILLAALGVNLIFTFRNINWAETAGIVVAVLISTVVSAISEYGSEKAFEKMQKTQRAQTVRVIRNGAPVEVPGVELVVGDTVLLHEGERIAADGEIVEGEVKVDQSAINGESKPATKRPGGKDAERKKLYAGSLISEGECVMCVTAVGDGSVYGKIAGDVQFVNEDSPLRARLTKLAKAISKIGYAAAALVAFTYLFNAFVIESNFEIYEIFARLSNLRYVALRLIKAVTIAMTVIVVAVPEGLPMMITVVLSSNMRKMLKDRVLVRKLVGIETAGSMNILFTDKTGTLTEGKPVCKEVVFGTGDRYNGGKLSEKIGKLLKNSVFLNSGCKMNGSEPIGGNATEQALCRFMKEPGYDTEAVKKLPFNSANKYSMALEKGGTVYVKGAAEKILPYCRACYDLQGEKTVFDRGRMQKLISNLGRQSKRIIVLATSDRFEAPEKARDLVFLCIAVLEDALRPTAKEAVRDLDHAGIQTVMITGDSKETAAKIAEECGIVRSGRDLVLSGEDLVHMSDEELVKMIGKTAVIARAMPSDKSRLISISKKAGLVAGMTGDGVNDAPALKMADVGFAMGAGTEIAKEAGDIIILDNDLSSIVNAVLYGRTVFKSIRKFITFQLIMNLCAVGVSLFGQIIGIENPITVIQMLWVNVIMDTLGGLAFAGEHPQRYYLLEKPISREEPILEKKTYFHILLTGGYAVVLNSLFLASKTARNVFGFDLDPIPMLTAFFALFIFTGIVVSFTTRSERVNVLSGLGKNKAFIVIMGMIFAIQMIMLYFGGTTFRCVGLSARALITVAMLSITVLPMDLLRRILQKKLENRLGSKTKRRKSHHKKETIAGI